MRLEPYLLYVLPLLARAWLAARSEAPAWTDVLLSQIPLAIVAPSSFLPRCIHDDEREHVVRHALYAAAFTAAIPCALRLPIDHGALLLYAVVGAATLWWFVLSHAIENAVDPRLRTHHGDVTVLPLTLVAIATFAESVPDDAFVFTRSTPFFVPVIVAWATLYFIAFQGFATQRATTHRHPGFGYHAFGALVVACVHLVLLEARARAEVFVVFPICAALACQAMPPYERRPTLRPGRYLGQVVVVASLALLVQRLVVRPRLGSASDVVFPASLLAMSVTLPWNCGRRFRLPAACLSAVASVALYEADARAPIALADALGLLAAHYLVVAVADLLCPVVWFPHVPDVPPPRDDGLRPQAGMWLCRCVSAARLPLGGRDDAARVLLARTADPACPADLRGVWWMDGNNFPMDLATVQHLPWSDGVATGRDNAILAYQATLSGYLFALFSVAKVTRMTVVSDRWIRTDTWSVPGLRLLHATYWIYRASPDVLLRVVYSPTGRLLWKYRLLKILTPAGDRTRHYATYLANGAPDARRIV
jgi:hypothetical protein